MDVKYYAYKDITYITHTNSMRSYPLHCHAFTGTVGFVISGEIELDHSNTITRLSAGCTFTILPYEPHSIKAVQPYDMLCISFKADSSLQKKPAWLNGLVNDMLADPSSHIDSHVSKYHLIHEFKKFMGLPPHKFRIHRMVRKAQKLLESGNSPSYVAQECGFYDQSHFIRHFKNLTALTPLAYKKAFINTMQE